MAKKKSTGKDRAKAAGQPDTDFVQKIANSRYLPLVVFVILPLIYFAPLLFEDNTSYISEAGLRGYGEEGGGFEYVKNPFAETNIWNPLLGGMPSSEGLHEYIFKIFNNLFIIFMYDFRAVNMYIACLTAFAGIAMFIFLRTIGAGRLLAIALGTAYMFSPHFMSFTYAGHISKMGVIAILPLLFTFLYRGIHTGKFRHFLWFGFFIALDIFTAHLQKVHFSLLATGFYFVYELAAQYLKEKNIQDTLKKTGFYVIAVLIGLGIGARGFMPQYLYTKTESKRAGQQGEGLTQEYASSWGLHAEEIASLVVPEFGNYDIPTSQKNHYWGKNAFKLNADYFGGIIFVLAFLSLFMFRRRREVPFFFCLMIFGLMFACGGNNPVFLIMYHLVPGIKSFRAPSLMFFVSAFSAFALAGIFLQELFAGKLDKTRIAGFMFIGVAALCIIGAANPEIYLSPWKALLYPEISDAKQAILGQNIPELRTGFLVSFLFFGLFGAGLLMIGRKLLRPSVMALALIPLFIVDFWRIDRDFLAYTPINPGVDPAGKKIAAYEFILAQDAGPYRVMPMHIRSLNEKFSYPGINTITGFHDFTMRRYDLMFKSLGKYGNEGLQHMINLLSGQYIVVPQQVGGAIFFQDGLSVVKNQEALPYFYVRDKAVLKTDESEIIDTILTNSLDLNNNVIIEKEPPDGFAVMLGQDSVQVKADVSVERFELSSGEVDLRVSLDAPGMLVFNENFHPGWHCTVDGAETEIFRANFLSQGVYLSEGEHTVQFRFVNEIISLSRTIMFLSFAVFLVLMVFAHRDMFGRFVKQKESE